MPRRPRSIPGPSRLSGILAHLTRPPRLELQTALTKLQLSYKFKNGDFGARSVFSPLLFAVFHDITLFGESLQLRSLCARLTKFTLSGRYFVKEELPRIRYANPNLQIEVDKLNPSNPTHKTKEPLMVLEFSKHRPSRLFYIQI
jgi:small subunit ribosomal protein S25